MLYSLKFGLQLKNFNAFFPNDSEVFNLIIHSRHSDDCLWYMILRGKQKKQRHAQIKNFPYFLIVRSKNNRKSQMYLEKPKRPLSNAVIVVSWTTTQ